MIDLHSHILWGLDDGAKTLEESVAMVRLAAETGTTDLVATPHANHQYRFDADKVVRRLEELRAAAGTIPRLYSGADFHLDVENIERALQDPAPFTVNRLAYLMVEFPDFAIPPGIRRVFQEMLARGIVPVITHPERNAHLRRSPRVMDDWLNDGCCIQI